MRAIDLAGFAGGAIVAHPLRSALTALGVVIGVAAVVMITAVGLGAQQQVTSAIAGLGSNLIVVTPNYQRGPGQARQGAGSGFTLTDGDAEAIRRQVDGVVAVSANVNGRAQLVVGGANWNTRVEGVEPGYLLARDLTLASGRMFDEREARQGRSVAVIGQTVVDELFGGADPVGQRMRVGSTPVEIVGVLTSKGQTGIGQDQDDIVLMPLSAARRRVTGRRFRGDVVQQIFVKAADEDSLFRVQEDATNLLRDRHRIPPGEADDFQVQNLASILEAGQAAAQTFTVLLGSIAAVSLLVGGVGIMNIMLVAVTERTREIGLRMAVGARRAHVLIQFALEAVVLSLGGGLVGLAIGVGGAYLIAAVGDLPAAIPTWAAPLAMGFSLAVGLVFGAYPSWRAAQLDPIEALRRE